MKPIFSFVIPVYNRPYEVDELLSSFTYQYAQDMIKEIIIVEDGSTVPCDEMVDLYKDSLPLKYLVKPNSGPGDSRNYGVAHAEGEFVIILDSDIVLPDKYIESVTEALYPNGLDGEPSCEAFGGPDRAHFRFTPVQKAINYGMTSFFTTGGIRGGDRKGKHGPRLDKFYPRSYNMGIRRDVYNRLGGFSKMRFGEDIDFSYRLVESGARCRLFPTAWVYHKRRATFRQFFKQVHNSGIARINLGLRHPGTTKAVHCLPAAFTVGCIGCLALALLHPAFLIPLALYALIILADSTVKNRSLRVGILSVAAAYIQLIGYGTGFIRCFWQRRVLKRGEFEAFKHNFYK